jgi:6,7-dimethyl-8-ribityllumazine synthase
MPYKLIEGNTSQKNIKIGIVVSKWNSNITEQMLEGALAALRGNGVTEEDITVIKCPGSFEIPLTADYLLNKTDVDGVIALGVVIRGGTPHFEYVCNAVTKGVIELNLKYQKPVAFGVLTTDDVKQALDRAGAKGNKGGEAALALLEMIDIGVKMDANLDQLA